MVSQFSQEIYIGSKPVSTLQKPFLVAELSANHNNEIDRAKKIIKAAAESGADAIKFQTYTADTITLDAKTDDFALGKGLWEGRFLYDLYSEGSLPWEWHEELFHYARTLGLSVISSPFDETAVKFLVDIGVDALKIASFELTHIPLIVEAARTGLPVILSTGMGTDEEIGEAVRQIATCSSEVILLHCVSAYPARPEEYAIRNIQKLKDKFGVLVGISDHCETNEIAAASCLLGSVFVEKHFTIDREGGGLDDSFSQEPSGFTSLRNMLDSLHAAQSYAPQIVDGEQESLRYRRSIYCSSPIAKGDVFTVENIKVVRPGFGLHPRHYFELLGKTAWRDIGFAEPISIDDLSNAIL